MRPGWLMRLIAALALCLCLAGLSSAGEAMYDESAVRAQKLVAAFEAGQIKIIALCELGQKAAAPYPDLAERYFDLAWHAAQDLPREPARNLAAELRGSAQYPRAGRLAEGLEQLADSAWPWAILAARARVTKPELAARAWEEGVRLARQNPRPKERDRDLTSLIQTANPADPARARELAGLVSSPAAKARAWLEVAWATRLRADFHRAREAGQDMGDVGERALFLAEMGRRLSGLDRHWCAKLLEEGFALAKELERPLARARVQGRIAAILAGIEPGAGAAMAGRIQGKQGERFGAYLEAGRMLIASNPAQGRQVLIQALDQAKALPTAWERTRAGTLAAVSLARVDEAAARQALKETPPGAFMLLGRIQAALVLAKASRDPKEAFAKSREIVDVGQRLLVLARLASSKSGPGAETGAWADFQDLAAQADEYSLAQPLGLLAGVWPQKTLKWAHKLKSPFLKARFLWKVAAGLAKNGDLAGAEKLCGIIRQELNSVKKGEQILDKARLLGDMGRVMSTIQVKKARRFFEWGAASVLDLG